MGKHKKKLKKHKKSNRRKSSSSSSSSEEEWVEKKSTSSIVKEDTKPTNSENKRDEWMSLSSLFATSSNEDRRNEREEKKQKEKQSSQYDPRNSVRELNPYWKSGGDGLPTQTKVNKFMKPNNEENSYKSSFKPKSSQSNWRRNFPESKPCSSKTYSENSSQNFEDKNKIHNKPEESSSDYLTDKEMNEIGAKIVKAEILGNTIKVKELKEKLEKARNYRKTHQNEEEEEENIILTRTDLKGFTKPLHAPETKDYHKRKKNKIETHDAGKRQKYFPDDDKYSLKQMFENEKFNTAEQQDAEFLKLTAKVSKMDDMDDLFVDKIRSEKLTEKSREKDKDKAISEHRKMTESLNNCQQCLQTTAKHLIVSLGDTIYLSLPFHEPLTNGHCILVPIRHVACSTQLDENEWSEITDFRKSLTKMFSSRDEDVIFYETVLNANSYSHMVINCVPIPKEQGDLGPIYFKKAIDECETEWSTNKKLISLSGKDVRRAVPKGLPYFFVSFGMTEGYAHVIEDSRYFSRYFAAEIIGGILDLHHSKWRKPRNEKFDEQKARVLDFTNLWKKYDLTNKN